MIRRLLAVASYLVVVTLVLGFLGVGGYRAGFVWLALAIPVAATALTWLALRTVDTNKALWCVAVALIGLTVAAKLVDLAPESTSRLDQRLDRLALPFYKTVSETRSGHGWCRPHCPRVVRVYRAPATGPRAAYFTMLLALRQQHLLAAKQPIPDVTKAGTATVVRTRKLVVTLRASPPTASIEIQARR